MYKLDEKTKKSGPGASCAFLSVFYGPLNTGGCKTNFYCLMNFCKFLSNPPVIRANDDFLSHVKHGFQNFWSIFCTTFGLGMKASDGDGDSSSFVRVFTFVICLSGSFVFIHYRASLTTQLTTTRLELPFHSLEEMTHTNFQ
jgi:hypothetical protein